MRISVIWVRVRVTVRLRVKVRVRVRVRVTARGTMYRSHDAERPTT